MAGCHIDAPVLPEYSFKIWIVIGLSMNIRLGDLRGGTIKLFLTVMGLNFELHMKNLYFFAVQSVLIRCLMLEFYDIEDLLDVVTQYEILGLRKLGLIR